MKVTVSINQLNGRRLEKLRRELGYLEASDFFRTVPLAAERSEVLDYMERISPVGDNPSKTKVWLAERGIRPFLPQFSKGWRMKRFTQGNRLSWQITHILESSPATGARAKFRSIEFGSRTSTWTVPRDYSFKDAAGRWHHFSEGEEVIHWGNPPAGVIEKTSDFVRLVMVPKVAAKVQTLIESRLSRI